MPTYSNIHTNTNANTNIRRAPALGTGLQQRHLNRVSIRIERRKRQGSQQRILYYIQSKFNKNRPQEEARQPREVIASYLNKISIRNDLKRRQGSQGRILHHIKTGFNKQRPQDEARQPQEENGIIFA